MMSDLINQLVDEALERWKVGSEIDLEATSVKVRDWDRGRFTLDLHRARELDRTGVTTAMMLPRRRFSPSSPPSLRVRTAPSHGRVQTDIHREVFSE